MNSDLAIKRLLAQDTCTRDQIQAICVQASKEHDKLFLYHVTSLGKTGALFKICSDPTKKVLVSHNQGLHIENMVKEAAKRNIDISHFTHTLWNSYHKLAGQHFDYIAIDEADYNLKGHIEFLKTVTYDKLILLTGTITQDQLNLLKKEIDPFVFKFTLNDAIRLGVLPEPQIYVKLIQLDDKEVNTQVSKNFKATELKASQAFDDNMLKIQDKLKHECELLTEKLTYEKSVELLKRDFKDTVLKEKLNLLQNNYYKKVKYSKDKFNNIETEELNLESPLTSQIESELYNLNFYKQARSSIYHMDNWTFKSQILLGGERKRFFEAVKMREFVKGNYYNRLKDKRCIFFLDTVEHCEEYGNSITYKSAKKNQKTVEDFNNFKINHFCTKKIVNRAMSVEDIRFGLITTFDFGGSSTKQMLGRMLRANGIPQIIIFICKDTKEEKLFNQHFINYGGKIQYI